MEVGAGAEIGLQRQQEASVSDAAGKRKKERPKHATPCEGSEVLAKKKEAFAAFSLWSAIDVPGAIDLWLDSQAKAKEAAAAGIITGKKKKKVIKYKMSNALVEGMMRRHCNIAVQDISEEELATRSAAYRHVHPFDKFIEGKMEDY
uniref:Uncharacterized protein n=1 Tax=Leersia perrieri TaxID=77586 RepID=A0A0D9W895_9ORYZ